jgi:hypothetical protein
MENIMGIRRFLNNIIFNLFIVKNKYKINIIFKILSIFISILIIFSSCENKRNNLYEINNYGEESKNILENEFKKLTDEEIVLIGNIKIIRYVTPLIDENTGLLWFFVLDQPFNIIVKDKTETINEVKIRFNFNTMAWAFNTVDKYEIHGHLVLPLSDDYNSEIILLINNIKSMVEYNINK